jgi:hypothetical protein
MQLDVASYRRVAERWASKDEDINPSAAAVLMLQMCSEIERLRITPEERAAIEGLMIGGCEPPEEVLNAEIDAVRGLLARHA